MLSSKFVPKDHFYLACSGGVDSIAAAHFLKKQGFNFTVFHFNHRYQDANIKMERAVRDFCEKFHIPFKLAYRPSDSELPENESIEASLRKMRIDAYKALKGNIVTAHHLDDCVESHLMNFFNGKEDYCPIPIETPIGDFKIIHPFMLCEKDDFVRHALNSQLGEFIINDPTNQDVMFRRNWIRNTVLPLISNQGIGMKTIVRKRMNSFYKKFYTN